MKRRPLVIAGIVALSLAAALTWMFRVPSGPVMPTGKAPHATGWQAVTVINGLVHPWSVAWLPTGEMLIAEKFGHLRLARNGALASEPISGLSEIRSGERSLLMDVSLHPHFAENRWVYLTYGTGTSESSSTRLARGRLSEDLTSITDFQVLHIVSPAKPGFAHFGSRLLWLPDGTLLLALGDGGNPPLRLDGQLMREQAQKLDSQLGKILRLRDDGTVPPDNPFAGRAGVDPFIWTYGHRNVQGLARDAVSGRIWANEHGSRGGDELNRLTAGGNYGWPRATYSIEYTFGIISRETSRPGMVDPVVVWSPAQAPSGLLFYRGDKFPQWRGDLFSGSLKRKEVRHIDLDVEGNVIGQQSLIIGDRVRDVRQGPDGFIYVLTDAENGRLLRIGPQSN
ncbi:PQQ-dependent sugar dehydrogenase [Rariglobus hedericola]|uniref:PQQ-dependent sugar dehydrogenase n=1 Tax=Rariglobus hedericola TaxID=2597822 RepID=A0A556QN23_9BACT|nr:PQQ-dependent sugar dehydrogenase [Rariglobus hedericola]TSJ78046.1 PQQ-dependent sugar dehydrogenase [Rariglobus hedericola]